MTKLSGQQGSFNSIYWKQQNVNFKKKILSQSSSHFQQAFPLEKIQPALAVEACAGIWKTV